MQIGVVKLSHVLDLRSRDWRTVGFRPHRRYVLVSTGLGKMNTGSISVSKHDVIYPVSNKEQPDMRVQKRCRKISLLKVFEASEEPATAFTLNTASGTAVRN